MDDAVEGVMKIGDMYNAQIAAPAARPAEQPVTTGRASGKSSPEPAGDRSEVSSLADLVGKTALDAETSRSARIDRLRMLYESDAYEPDSLALSRALVTAALKEP